MINHLDNSVDTPAYSADIQNRALEMLDPDTIEILARQRAELRLHTAMAAISVAQAIELDPAAEMEFATSLMAKLDTLPPDHHRQANRHLAGLMTLLVIEVQPPVIALVEDTPQIVEQVDLTAATTIENTDVTVADDTEEENTQAQLVGEDIVFDPREVTVTDERPAAEETAAEQPVVDAQPQEKNPSLLDRALSRLPVITERQIVENPSTESMAAATDAQETALLHVPTLTDAQEATPTDVPTHSAEVSSTTGRSDTTPELPKVSPAATTEIRPALNFFDKLNLKRHETIPNPMREFIAKVMNTSETRQLLDELDVESAGLISYMLISEYVEKRMQKLGDHSSRIRGALFMSRVVGMHDRPHTHTEIGRAQNILGFGVSDKTARAMSAIEREMTPERKEEILKAGLRKTLVPDLLEKVLMEAALAPKK